jgi:hypothetical protein
MTKQRIVDICWSAALALAACALLRELIASGVADGVGRVCGAG